MGKIRHEKDADRQRQPAHALFDPVKDLPDRWTGHMAGHMRSAGSIKLKSAGCWPT
jgi:hypothetical protein